MTPPIIIPLPGNELLAGKLAIALGGELGSLETRRFPDGESYLRFRTKPDGRSLVIVCTLDQPDDKVLQLLFAAGAARDLGAARVGLVAPYLAYMRQDNEFKDGEAVTSAHFARLLSSNFDWVITIDPHLHRYRGLAEIYRIPAVALHAAPLLSDWIKRHVRRPLLVGPDAESDQWVREVALGANAPYIVLRKQRFGDRDVEVTAPELSKWMEFTPVLVDDIISSAQTMIETARQVMAGGLLRPICVAVHALFAESSYRLLKVTAARIATTNTVPHETNAIDILPLLANGTAKLV